MGRKSRLYHKKNFERKRQASGLNKVGRPRKKIKQCQGNVSHHSHDLLLPEEWITKTSKGVLTISKMQLTKEPPIITHSLNVSQDGQWTLYVHNKKINSDNCEALRSFPNPTSNIKSLVNHIDSLCVCPGHPDKEFVDMLQHKKGSIRSHRGQIVAKLESHGDVYIDGVIYETTVRPIMCEILTSKSSRCLSCLSYRANLRAIYSNYKKETTTKANLRCQPNSKTNYRYLRTPEKHKRLTNLRIEAIRAKKEVELLRKRINDSIEKHSIIVEEDIDDDLNSIMKDHHKVIEEKHAPDSFHQLFWEEQVKARSKQDSRSMRWHPMMVRWCLNMKLLSPCAYSALRASHILKLPSERTLRDYTHWVKAKPGFQSEVDCQLKDEAFSVSLDNGDGDHLRSYVCLVFDEVKIEEGLVYDKECSTLIGFVELDDISNHFSLSEKPELATHMLVFMVRGLFSALQFPNVQFPTSNLSGGTLYPLVWSCIAHLEMLGFKVLAVTADGASPNRRFFKLNSGNCKSKFTYKTVNIYSKDGQRPLFFFSDVPHLIKTIRNSWANSGSHAFSKRLQINGEVIKWDILNTLHQKHRRMVAGGGLTILPKLKAEHIFLTSYSKMRVDLAVQVLSSTVAAAIERDFPNLKETVRFIRMCDRFFDIMNVRSMKESIYKRKPDRRPYTATSDNHNSRLEWLILEFLPYLKEWESYVETFTDKTVKERKRMCIAKETIEGLRITVKYIFTNIPGVKVFFSEKLCQDPVEAFFGRQRMRGGYSSNPTVKSFLQGTVSLRAQRSVGLNPVRGNCKRGLAYTDPKVDHTPLPKRPRKGLKDSTNTL